MGNRKCARLIYRRRQRRTGTVEKFKLGRGGVVVEGDTPFRWPKTITPPKCTKILSTHTAGTDNRPPFRNNGYGEIVEHLKKCIAVRYNDYNHYYYYTMEI